MYLRFGKEIQSFTENLQQLDAVIEHADSKRVRPPQSTPKDEWQLALQPMAQAVGDFEKTLDECKKLLDDNETFERDSAGFVNNVVWGMWTRRDVDILRDRVHFHLIKVRPKTCDSKLFQFH